LKEVVVMKYRVTGIYADCLGGSRFEGEIETDEEGNFQGTVTDRYGSGAIKGILMDDHLHFKKGYKEVPLVGRLCLDATSFDEGGYLYEYSPTPTDSPAAKDGWQWLGKWTLVSTGEIMDTACSLTRI